ncbi:hypothetical protein Sme01_37570 [Sphaerisporangium melleum]|uniref:Tat pathway signal sequence domain protein n=1 Tax=Sphaerisporangium melleum TaxID=321316 RepID=A0A917RBK3_9ACTN|nr:DUF4429 domain-containing protein [Sphaerisporangium melleum]GGK99920.1 hypothetical protein GCM10007964_47520 [Sphaerisporangium melleum]GII71281.1 hypothetical protein Sme01_37570 [Sphaerisporangium melleum]
MAEILVPDGSWTFDGETLRIAPGGDKGVHELRRVLGEVTIPLAAIAGVSFESSRKGGGLQVRLRQGADPLTDVVAGRLLGAVDPYRLTIPRERAGAAEYLAEEVRTSLLLEQVPTGPSERYLLPGPAVPVSAHAGDGSVSFDGERVHLEWTLFASSAKEAAGPQTLLLAELSGVEWAPQSGVGYGRLRFHLKGRTPVKKPEQDPHCLSWGVQRYGGTTALVAAAVLARLPKDQEPSALTAPPSGDHDALLRRVAELESHDTLIRRLTELGELHRSGVLTDEEFTAAKHLLLHPQAPPG